MKLKEQIDRELSDITPQETILQDILNSEGPRAWYPRKAGLILCSLTLVLILAIPVSAGMFGTISKTTRITDENRDMVGQPDIAVAEEAPVDAEIWKEPELLMDDLEKAAEVTDGIIQRIDDGAFLPNTVTVINLSSTEEGSSWAIPELLTANGFTTIYTKENGEGWTLKKGETITIRYSIGATTKADKKKPQKGMEIGYICDHTYYEGELFTAQEFEYTLTAPEDGVYYLYNINAAAGKIYITGGEIY